MAIRFVSSSLVPSSSFYARQSGSESGSLVSTAYTVVVGKDLGEIKDDFDNNNITFNLTSQSFGGSNDVKALVISASQDRPFIGIGTDNPKSTFDVKDVQNSALGTRFLLKSSRTTTGAQVGDSAGSINFAIDSASFNDIFTSGSVASIDSKVRAIDTSGGGTPNVAGNIILKSSPEWIETLNEVAEIGHFHFDNLDPTEDSEPGMIINGQLTVGSGSTWQSQAGDVAFSVHNVDGPNIGNNLLKFRITGSNAVIHSGSLTIGSGSLFLGETYSGATQVEFVNLRGGAPIKLGHISGGGGNHPLEIYTANGQLAAKFDNLQNLGIGTSQNTAPEKLTVQGNISASGNLTATNGSFSGDLTVEGDIIAQNYIVSSSVTYMTQSFSSGSTIFGDTLDDTHQFTGSILYTGSLDINGMTYPTTDGEDGQVLLTDGDGALTFGDVKVYAQVKNISGTTLAKGTPVHATSSASPPAGNVSEVIAASASLAPTMPATFILDEELADDAEGRAILSGFINGIDTSAFNEGDVVYVGPDGGYTTTKPTGTNLIQNLGIITKVDASNGAGYIYGSGRSNDVPNLLDNQIFFGSGSNQSQQIHISGALDSTTINNITASGEIETNTISNVTTVIGSDSATNVDTFATSTYNGAIYDYVLKDSTVGARAGQFMVAHDNGSVTFTDTSTKHLTDSTIPEITADINGADVRIRITNGNGYTFKSFVKKL